MKILFLRSLGVLGLLLFLPLFILTFINPNKIENSAKPFIKWKLNIEVNKKIDSFTILKSKNKNTFLGKVGNKFSTITNNKLEKLKEQLKLIASRSIIKDFKAMNDKNCKCREIWNNRISEFLNLRIVSFEKAKEKLSNFTRAKYMEIVKKLIIDLRIFLGANSFVFILILLVSFLKNKSKDILVIPSVLMLTATIVSTYFYLFSQNWFYTILFNDYVGFGYIIYLLLVFSMLCDIVFNDSRILKSIINFIGNIFSSASC